MVKILVVTGMGIKVSSYDVMSYEPSLHNYVQHSPLGVGQAECWTGPRGPS